MTGNEQIMEMANDLLQHCPDLAQECCPDSPCVSCLTKFLFNAGYRKVERGEWIEKTHDWDFGDYIDYTCSICGSREQNKRKFCPECGADMRGDER